MVLRANEKTFSELSELFPQNELMDIVRELEKGFPLVKTVEKSSYGTDYLKPIAVTRSDSTCSQLINRSSSGLLMYLPESVGTLKMNFSQDALGRVLPGDDGRLIESDYHSHEGLKLTVDSRVQSILYDEMKAVKKGCAVIIDVESGAVLACVTKPDDSYVNKVFSQFAVGSVFKTVVAACAIENGIDPSFDCNGHIRVGDTIFSCYEDKAHGKQHLKEALGNSCNCYFVNLGLQLGADRLLSTAKRLGFDSTTTLFDEWKVTNAVLPDESALYSKGELSLLSFGQGKLTATPLQFCYLMTAIANHGYAHPIRLIEAEVDSEGKASPVAESDGKQVITADTADLLLSYLRYVVSDGNAGSADFHDNAAGKTATAQTGQFQNGDELLNCWFTGVYPYDDPQYAIVIMVEEGEGGAKECCPIFRTVVEKLEQL